ncbi:MAG: N-acetylmuramoyl-L-alanine amidase [Pelagibacterales bacterium]|nr:N-acetylmuramoyl-L-alanine amidase [Pelagibacterales bacterium]
MMKLKSLKNKNYFCSFSPNYENKKSRNIKYVVIHYTGMKPLKRTLEKFNDPNSKVSCHWLISESGKVYKIVEEKNIAWHCGISKWKNLRGLNKYSIGIELDNPGHGKFYRNFSSLQMNSLVVLLKNILKKYSIDNKNVLAHSDVAPDRKFDPGELFRWDLLAQKKLAYFPPILKKIKKKNIFFQYGDSHEAILKIKKLLNRIGYSCDLNKAYDLKFKVTIEAFQRRFLPKSVNGIIDDNLYQRIIQVNENS